MEAKFAMGFRIHLAVNATIAELQHMRQAGSLGGVGHGVEGVVVVVVVAAVGLEKGAVLFIVYHDVMITRVGDESTRSFHNHGEGPFKSLILVASAFTFKNLIRTLC